jgi:CRISPR-associated protein Csx10
VVGIIAGGCIMTEIKLEITALSPLAIGSKKPRSVSESRDFIPGSTIRGAIANEMIRLGESSEGDDFHRLFIADDAAIFRNAYPASNLLPATAVSSKSDSGFKPDKNGVFDTLIDRFCAEGHGCLYDPSCPKDNGRVEPFSGFYDIIDGKYQSQSITKRLLTKVGINRHRATSEEEILYSVEVLNETYKDQDDKDKTDKPSVFYGSISIEDESLARDFINYINANSDRFRLGGSTSRGLGQVKLKAEAEIERSVNNVPENIQKFNDLLKIRWKKWSEIFREKELGNRAYFTIDLQSEGIFIDNWKRAIGITSQMLCEFANLEEAKSSLIFHTAYSSYDYLSGWNAAWGLMKDVELVTNKGSVFLFSTENPDLWIPALEYLSRRGIGERTSEGFGQIKVCDPFHLVLREGAK